LIRWSLRAVSGSRPSVGKVVAVLIVLPMNSMSCSLAAAAAFSLASVMLVFFSHSALLEATTSLRSSPSTWSTKVLAAADSSSFFAAGGVSFLTSTFLATVLVAGLPSLLG
jgi:hypothetical protein